MSIGRSVNVWKSPARGLNTRRKRAQIRIPVDFHLLGELQANDDVLPPCYTLVGVLKWKHDAKRMFFVTRHEHVAAYLKSQKEKRREGG